jgi:tRNA uridine 5-carbamoylmethylation protein Kti12
MNHTEVLLLHGSPGSGKSTLSVGISEQLRQADKAYAVIDLDELSIIYPPQDRFAHRNLKMIWPNYTAVPNLKVIIPTVIADTANYQSLRDAIPAPKVMICELTAPKSILIDRVNAREPNAYWQERLRKWVDIYHQRDESQKFGDFQATTHDKSVDETAKEIIKKAGWDT